jgi:hypothetical protein
MNTLQAEHHRLYCAAPSALLAPDSRVRALVLEVTGPSVWTALSQVWRGVQSELELPASAIAVNGVDGYQLWFSLVAAVESALAGVFLEGLRKRYLADVVPSRVRLWPTPDTAAPEGWRHATLVPALQASTQHWSALVAPDLAAIFEEEPWLDLTPSAEAQASVLAGLQSIKPAQFQRALEMLRLVDPAPAPAPAEAPQVSAPTAFEAREPRAFLLEVMNNPGVPLQLRMEAAKALLPYAKD